jgi:hypothetical protein
LRVISLGEIKAVADIAAKAALGPPIPDRRTSIVAGRALMAAGDETQKKQYATFVMANCAALPAAVVWDALEKLFPACFGVADLLDIMSRVDVTATDGGLGLDWHGPKLVARMNTPSELEAAVTGLLSQLGGTVAGERFLTKRQEVYISLIAAAAHRLLELSPVDQVSTPAIAAAARLSESARWSRSTQNATGDVVNELQRSASRRRLAFWGVAERLAGHRMLGGRPIDSLWDMQMLGWSVALSVDDIDWLLADGPLRKTDHERQLATNTAMAIWRNAESPDTLRERIAAVAKADPAMTAALDGWLNPRQPSPEFTRQENEIKRLERRNALERAKRDRSWVDFAARLRGNPAEMRNLRPTTAEGTDSRLYSLWQLLSQTADADHRYALDSVAPLKPMIGPEAAEGFRLGLIAHWRAWIPWVRSVRDDGELNQVRQLDCMGLVGISLEAKDQPGWAATLSSDDARCAVGYATLEPNGFPVWLADLARAKPDDVRAVLSNEVLAELKRSSDVPRFGGVLQDIARGDKVIAELMAPFVLAEIEARPNLATEMLSLALDIVLRGGTAERKRLNALALERFDHARDAAQSSLYIGTAFAIDGAAATAAVFAKLDNLDPADQPVLVQHVLPHIFGRQFSDEELAIENLPLDGLERLVRLAYQTIRPENDNVRLNGEVYSPDARDDAEHARSAAFGRLVNTPNRAGFDAILRLAEVPDFPVPKARLYELAKERAEKDSESAAWNPGEAAAFEKSAETEPQTPRDLQLVALHRLADMQHDLLHGDFQQGETLAGLENENAVQRWTADRLDLKRGRSYAVDREVHVADEKEPDIRLRAKATDANVPIEVKVVESWTLEELEAALKTQLCGQYLRTRGGRHGILLLVHQKTRPIGWQDRDGTMLTFDQVVNHLRRMAVTIAGASSDGPQPEIAVLDVSSFTAVKAAKEATKAKKTPERRKNKG